jgi:hypothetical protein
MPTAAQNAARTAAICDAIKNGTSTATEQNTLAEAIYGMDAASYAALSNADRAAISPRFIRQMALNIVDQYEANKAQANRPKAATLLPEVQ